MANVELIADASAKYRMCTIFTFDSTMSAMEPQKFFILWIKKEKLKVMRKGYWGQKREDIKAGSFSF